MKRIEAIKKSVDNVPRLVEEACVDIANKANSAAPIGVSVFATGNVITANGPLAAYHEFGTGPAAEQYTRTLPEEWDKYAETFIVNKKGTLLESAYLFPAFESERPQLIKKIKESFK